MAWGRRRPWTLGLAGFFLFWYGLQIAVFTHVSEDAARWWFYYEQPPNDVSPSVLLGPMSHDMYTQTHVGANVWILVIVGSYAESYIGSGRLLIMVVGMGYVSMYLANATASIHRLWMVDGASGGILALFSYTGLRMSRPSSAGIADGLSRSVDGLEALLGVALLIGILVFLIHQALWIPRPHSGHVLGLLLGCLFFGVEVYFDDEESTG